MTFTVSTINAGVVRLAVEGELDAVTVPDLRKIPFIDARLVAKISPRENVTLLSDTFETAVSGLYAVGLTAMHNFGPLMRFMVGAEFAAPRLASALHRRLARAPEKRAA